MAVAAWDDKYFVAPLSTFDTKGRVQHELYVYLYLIVVTGGVWLSDCLNDSADQGAKGSKSWLVNIHRTPQSNTRHTDTVTKVLSIDTVGRVKFLKNYVYLYFRATNPSVTTITTITA